MHRGHRSLELLEGRWIRRAANDFPCEQPRHVCCLEQAFRRLQATQRIADFGEPALDRRNCRSFDAGAAAVGGALPEPAQFTLQRLDRAARHRLLQRPTDLCEFCEQPSADLLEGARLLGPANLGARGDRAEGPLGRREAAMVVVTRRAARSGAARTPAATVIQRILAAARRATAATRAGLFTPGPCDLPRNTRFHCRIRMLDRVQRSPDGSVKPAKGDRQWMAALIPGAVFVLRVKMRLRPPRAAGSQRHKKSGTSCWAAPNREVFSVSTSLPERQLRARRPRDFAISQRMLLIAASSDPPSRRKR